jgi:Resolvase, N terminal domain
MTKIAFYARISRNDGVQDVENQLHELRTWATRLGGDVVAEYVDQVSGAKNGDARPALQEALHASHERRHDVYCSSGRSIVSAGAACWPWRGSSNGSSGAASSSRA